MEARKRGDHKLVNILIPKRLGLFFHLTTLQPGLPAVVSDVQIGELSSRLLQEGPLFQQEGQLFKRE